MVSPRVLAFAGLGVLAIAACAQVLGIDDRTLDPRYGDGGIVQGDSALGSDSNPFGGDSSMGRDSPNPGDAPVDLGNCGANFQTDMHNCGRCGHDCLGGACTMGQCQSVVLASGITPWGIAVDSTNVYWTGINIDGNVIKADKTNGMNRVTLIDFNDPGGRVAWPLSISVDSTSVYVGDLTSYFVYKCAITGCNDNPTTIGYLDAGNGVVCGGCPSPVRIAVDATYVYWTDGQDSVWRAPKAGNGQTQLLATYTGMSPFGIAVDSQFVYFTNNTDGTLQKVPTDGGAMTKVASGQSNAAELTLGNGSLYWSQYADPGGLFSTTTAGPAVNTLASMQHLPLGVAVDATNIYWVNTGTFTGQVSNKDGTVMMCPIANCSMPTALASNQDAPKGIAVDAQAVYWTTLGQGMLGNETGTVMKIAKP